jgi:hypothetical protein
MAEGSGSAVSSHLGAKVSVRSGLAALHTDADVLSTALIRRSAISVVRLVH